MTTAIQHYRHDYLQPRFDEATAMDVMHPGVLTCPPDTPARDAARAMTDHGIHALVVGGIQHTESGERLVWGVFTDMDLVRAARAGELDRAVGGLATAAPATVELDAPLAEVAGVMSDSGVSHVIAVHGGRPAGVVSSADLTRAIAWSRE